MIWRANTTMNEFERWLSIAARDGNMPSQFIDLVDSLDQAGLQADLEKAESDASEAEEKASDLVDELKTLCDALDDFEDTFDGEMTPALSRALSLAKKATERHNA